MSTNNLPQDILQFWFGGSPIENAKLWWGKHPDIDARIKAAHTDDIDKAMQGEYADWQTDPESYLALIILLDQFPRNVYRNDPKTYVCDKRALELALQGIKKGIDKQLNISQRTFFYMPLEHAEDKAIQQRCVGLFQKMTDEANEQDQSFCQGFLDFAISHKKVIDRFGRFPHRNKILGRDSTPEEVEYLNQPNAGF